MAKAANVQEFDHALHNHKTSKPWTGKQKLQHWMKTKWLPEKKVKVVYVFSLQQHRYLPTKDRAHTLIIYISI